MKVTEEMILLVIQQRIKWVKGYLSSDWENVYDISDAEECIDHIKPLVDEMHSLLEEFKKEQLENCDDSN